MIFLLYDTLFSNCNLKCEHDSSVQNAQMYEVEIYARFLRAVVFFIP